jgi:hypothetical protein
VTSATMDEVQAKLHEAARCILDARRILGEADTLRQAGNRLLAQGHRLKMQAIAECREKPDSIDQQTWENFRCSDE